MRSTRKIAKDRAWHWFSQWVRLRDAIATTGTTTEAVCVTCPNRYPIKMMDCGHPIAGRHDAVLFDEDCSAQCTYCNVYKGGQPSKFMQVLSNRYGAGYVEEKFQESWKIVKYTEQDFRDIADKYRKKYNQLLRDFRDLKIDTSRLPF